MSAFRVTIGVDPGLSGALYTLVDGEPGRFLDMPTVEFGNSREVDAAAVACWIRDVRKEHAGAWICAVMERVSARPGDGGTSAFRFGEGSGALRGVFQTLGIPLERVVPAVWKRSLGLLGTDKDAARQLALAVYPSEANALKRKKDDGRADALLIARWYEWTQGHPHVVRA